MSIIALMNWIIPDPFSNVYLPNLTALILQPIFSRMMGSFGHFGALSREVDLLD
jgi:hypothetical protein